MHLAACFGSDEIAFLHAVGLRSGTDDLQVQRAGVTVFIKMENAAAPQVGGGSIFHLFLASRRYAHALSCIVFSCLLIPGLRPSLSEPADEPGRAPRPGVVGFWHSPVTRSIRSLRH